VPLVIPWLFIGIALLTFFSRTQVTLSMTTIVIGHVIVTLPIVILIVTSRLTNLDPNVMEAARDLGAGAFQAFRRILLPQIAPALAGAALLAIATSLDEFVITLFTNGGVQTVPIVIYGSLRRGLTPSVNAIASLTLLATITLTIVAGRFVSVRELSRKA
jgi:spermidine/putrescine transport system permease protein